MAQPKAEKGLFREAGKKKDIEEEERLRNLAYAAFHCSSLRVRAASTSDCVTKREPTTPEEIEGIASGIASSAMMEMILTHERSAAFRTWLTSLQHRPVRLFQITINRKHSEAHRQQARPGEKSSQYPVRYRLCGAPASAHLCLRPQPGRKTSPPRLQPLNIIMNPHLRVARMRVVQTCRKTPRQGQAASTAGSRSPVAARCYGRTRSVPNLLRLLLTDSRGGRPSVSGFHTGRIVVHHLARRALNDGAVRVHSIVACA